MAVRFNVRMDDAEMSRISMDTGGAPPSSSPRTLSLEADPPVAPPRALDGISGDKARAGEHEMGVTAGSGSSGEGRAAPGSRESDLELSKATYAAGSEALDQAVRAAGYDDYRVVEAGGDRAVVATAQGAPVAVAFRGSDNIENWVSNLDVRHTDEGVHSGFEAGVDGLRAAGLDEAVSEMKQTAGTDSVSLCGHSRGGAMATILASQYDKQGQNVDHVTTFGSPAAGDARFAADYDQRLGSRTTPVVNDDDIVPEILGSELGYAPVASERRIDLEDDQRSRAGASSAGDGLDGLIDHEIEAYQRNLTGS